MQEIDHRPRSKQRQTKQNYVTNKSKLICTLITLGPNPTNIDLEKKTGFDLNFILVIETIYCSEN